MTATDRVPDPDRATSWKPPPDDELTWFRPNSVVPEQPRPLDATLAVAAFAFGLTHSLVSLYFPLYEVRHRLIDGHLYLATVPSPMAQRNLTAQMRRVRDSSLRFSRNIRAGWEPAARREVEGYNERMAAFPASGATDLEVADALPRLRRTRGNQWFISIRAVIAPTAMLQTGVGETPMAEALAVVQEMRDLVVGRGTAELRAAVGRVADRLVAKGCIAAPDDIDWLDLGEVREALQHGGDRRALVAERQAVAAAPAATDAPPTIGPPLLPDAPHMYLVREVLALIAGDGGF